MLTDKKVKAIDFGLSFDITDPSNHKPQRYGTYGYMAPEVAQGRVKDYEKADVFSFGIVMFELFTLRALLPREAEQYSKTLKKAVDPEKVTSYLTKAGIEEPMSKLIVQCLAYKSASRPKFQDIVDILENNMSK